jgi:hypothetical protein
MLHVTRATRVGEVKTTGLELLRPRKLSRKASSALLKLRLNLGGVTAVLARVLLLVGSKLHGADVVLPVLASVHLAAVMDMDANVDSGHGVSP